MLDDVDPCVVVIVVAQSINSVLLDTSSQSWQRWSARRLNEGGNPDDAVLNADSETFI